MENLARIAEQKVSPLLLSVKSSSNLSIGKNIQTTTRVRPLTSASAISIGEQNRRRLADREAATHAIHKPEVPSPFKSNFVFNRKRVGSATSGGLSVSKRRHILYGIEDQPKLMAWQRQVQHKIAQINKEQNRRVKTYERREQRQRLALLKAAIDDPTKEAGDLALNEGALRVVVIPVRPTPRLGDKVQVSASN